MLCNLFINNLIRISYISHQSPWNPMESAGVRWSWWSPVESSGLDQRKSPVLIRESARTWHIPVDFTRLDMPIWPLSHWKSLGDNSCRFLQIPVESDRIRQIVWGTVHSTLHSPTFSTGICWTHQNPVDLTGLQKCHILSLSGSAGVRWNKIK